MPPIGELVACSAAAGNAGISSLVGEGLSQLDSDHQLEHDTKESSMWLIKKGDLGDGLVFDLGQVTEIESMEVWNYNKPGYTSQGIAKADIAVLAEDGTWKPILKDAPILEAEGSASYDDPTILTFGPVKAQKVRLTNLVAFKDEGFIGLSKVRFRKPLGFEACNPEPQNNAKKKPSGQTRLIWTPGKDAVVCDIYAGLTPESLLFLGRTAEPEAILSGLVSGIPYFWRINAVKVDGTVTQGQLWSFALEKGKIWRNWNLDEIKNSKNLDGSSKNSVELMNDTKWLETDGIRKGFVEFDGSKNYMRAAALNRKSNTVTISLWMWADGIQNPFTGLAFCRGKNTVAGLNLNHDKELGYHWNNDPKTVEFSSGLVVPQNKWIFVAVAIEPTKATLFLYEDGQMKSATNTIPHSVEEFEDRLIFGYDSDNSNDRHFKGKMDDIKIFDYCLTSQQIQAVAENKPVEPIQPDVVLSLVDTKLIDPQTDLKTVVKQIQTQIREQEEDAGQSGKKRSLWPVVSFFGIILAIVLFVQIKKKQ